MLQQLQEDSQRLQELPKLALEPEFAAEVVSRIDAAQPHTVPVSASRVPRSLPGWVGLAVAASLLLAVTATSYLYYSVRNRPEPEHTLGLADFDRAAFQERVAIEARKNKGVQLDLTYQDGPEAVKRLRQAFEHNGIKLLPGPVDGNGELLVFAENINADELGGIVAQLSAEERKSHQFDLPQIQPFSAQEHRQVARSLGLRSLENEDDLFKNILPAPAKDKQSTPKKPPTPAPAVKDRVAIVLASGAVQGGQGTSAAVRDFLANRTAARPGTFRVVLVLRPASA
ncbi:MAG: hypothetical protein FJ271_10190 [Planctomycetes bacterium]|nr:hypothetical protein [Planctomycetota bacterium]